jgi:hypothetical protein
MKLAHPSGAKAHNDTSALMYGLKPVPSKFAPSESVLSKSVHSKPIELLQGLFFA